MKVSNFFKRSGIFLVLSSVLFLGSCSLAELGYRYGDWLLKRKILEVVKFYSPQQDRLEVILDEYMAWHKVTMLGRYQKHLDKTVKRFEEAFKEKGTPAISAQEVHDFLVQTRTLYWDSFLPLANKVAPLLSELGEEQVDRSKTLISRKLEDRKELTELSSKEYQEEMHQTWKENLEDWFGPLSDAQKEQLKNTLPKLLTSPKARFARAVSRMKEFLAIFEDIPESQKDYKEKRAQRLMSYFKSWSDERNFKKWRESVSSFMAGFLGSLSSEQQNHLLKKLKKWQKTLSEIKS